jgi:hypothetical protein
MTISLSVVQQLLVISALVWGLFPTWGTMAFGSTWLLLFFGSRARTRRAKKLVAEHAEKLTTLTPESRALMARFPLAYVWPRSAEGWGTTWQLTGTLSLFLGAAFGLQALIHWDARYLLFWIPVVGLLISGGAMARHLKVQERVLEDLKDLRITHDTTMTLLSLKTTMGQWPPEPTPDPIVEKKAKQAS